MTETALATVPALGHKSTLAPVTLIKSARSYAAASKAESTRTAYRSDWSRFVAWCGSHGLQNLPAEPATVALYLTNLADMGRRVSTIERALAAISEAHKMSGHESPRATAPVRVVLQGIRRTHGTAPRQVAPVLVNDLRRMVGALPDTIKGKRDRALLLLGFAGGFRRSELVAANVEDLEFAEDGLVINVRRGKTDQEGRGRNVGIPFGSDPATCPVRAVKAWLAEAHITEGGVFLSVTRGGRVGTRRRSGDARLSPRDVARVVKGAAAAVGLDPAKFAGHSLRAGLATSAAGAGKSERAISRQTGHRSLAVLRGYIRDGTLFADNAAAGIGL